MESDDIMTINPNMDTCSPTEEKISDEQTISCANNSGLRPSLLGGFPPQAKLASENTPNVVGSQIKHMVISGGGVTGFSFYGILRDTHRNGLWKLENIQTIYGTSIGAVLGVIMCLGYEWDILDTYLIKRPWQNLFKFDLYAIMNVFEKKGIFNINIFKEMFEPLFSGMDIPLDITMEQFYEKTGKEIHMFSTELNNMNSIDISYKTHPTWTVIQAVYCSSMVPIVFEPFFEENHCYLDGGFLINYPLKKCLSDTEANTDEILCLKKIQNTTSIPICSESTFFDYVMVAFNRLFEIVLNSYQGTETVKMKHEYTIVDGAISLKTIIDTATSMDERIRRINIGSEMVRCNYR